MVKVELLYFGGCPNWQETLDRLIEALALARLSGVTPVLVEVRSDEDAVRLGFRGSPTVLLDGHDPFADPAAPVGLACRVYPIPEGLRGAPTVDQLLAVLG